MIKTIVAILIALIATNAYSFGERHPLDETSWVVNGTELTMSMIEDEGSLIFTGFSGCSDYTAKMTIGESDSDGVFSTAVTNFYIEDTCTEEVEAEFIMLIVNTRFVQHDQDTLALYDSDMDQLLSLNYAGKINPHKPIHVPF